MTPAMECRETLQPEPLSPPVTAGNCSSCGDPLPAGRTNLRCRRCFSLAAKIKAKDRQRRGRITNIEALMLDGIMPEKKAWRPCLAEDHDHLIYTTKHERLCKTGRRHLSDVMDSSPSMTLEA